jgi:MFS family permease
MRAYGQILRIPAARRLALVMLPVRLGYAMAGLALVLIAVERIGSASAGGAALGLFSLGAGLLGPVRGRIVDRYGQTRPLLIYVPVFCAGFVALTAITTPWLLLTTAGIAGAMSPPLLASSRPLWRIVVPANLVRGAFALDSVSMQVTMIAGPAITGAIAVTWSPAVAMWTVASLVLVGGTAFVLMPASRQWPRTLQPPAWSSLLATAGLRSLMVVGAASGVISGALVVLLPSTSGRFDTFLGAGLLLAVVACGSVVGGIWAGSRIGTNAARGGAWAMAVIAVISLPLAAALDAPLPVLVALLLLLGGALGPAAIYLLELVDRTAPAGTAVTAFAGIVALEGATVAVGAIAAGAAVDNGRPYAACALIAVMATLAAITYRRRSVAMARHARAGIGASRAQ